MTYREPNAGYCSQCHDNDAWLVGTNSDGAYCDKCEETLVTDSDLVFGNDYRQKLQNGIQNLTIVAFLAGVAVGGVLIGSLLYEVGKGVTQ
jgi:hypothetical protein